MLGSVIGEFACLRFYTIQSRLLGDSEVPGRQTLLDISEGFAESGELLLLFLDCGDIFSEDGDLSLAERFQRYGEVAVGLLLR